MGFTLVFATELLVNLIATWPREFLNDPWNHFDTFTVSISVCTLMLPPSVLPPEGSDTLKVCSHALAALAHTSSVHGRTLTLHAATSEPSRNQKTYEYARRHPLRAVTPSLALLCMLARHPHHCCVLSLTCVDTMPGSAYLPGVPSDHLNPKP